MSSPLRDRLNRAREERYLQKPVQSIEIEMPPDSGTGGFQVHPWRRLAARMIDHLLYGLLGLPILVPAMLLGHVLLQSGDAPMALMGVLTALGVYVASGLMLEAFMLSYWGTTPGKWTMNLVVTDWKGDRLSFWAAFERSFSVMMFMSLGNLLNACMFAGLGLYAWQYLALSGKHYTLWDVARKSRVVRTPVREV